MPFKVRQFRKPDKKKESSDSFSSFGKCLSRCAKHNTSLNIIEPSSPKKINVRGIA